MMNAKTDGVPNWCSALSATLVFAVNKLAQVLGERGLLQLDDHQRQAVGEADQIRPAGVKSLIEYRRVLFWGKTPHDGSVLILTAKHSRDTSTNLPTPARIST